MERPPFKLAQVQSAGRGERQESYPRLADPCCKPDKPLAVVSRQTQAQRLRLVELDVNFLCSIIGTCLTTAELRKLVPRYAALDRDQATDLEIHHTAVQLAKQGGEAAKALQKAMDLRYDITLKRFKPAASDAALNTLWHAALDSGEVPGAYWALMTHPGASIELRQAAFGEVHMLSHLVGAANRADIRRLVAFEAEAAALKDKVERQQARLQEMSLQRETTQKQLGAQITQLNARLARQTTLPDTELAAEVTRLRQALDERDQRLALFTARRQEAERQALQSQQKSQQLEATLEQTRTIAETTAAELHALEETLSNSFASDDTDTSGTLAGLKDKHIVYVGGRPNSNAVLSRLVLASGGELTLHDGGIEDRRGLLAAVLPRAHMVVFPVDCIGHDAMATLKRVCARHGVDYHPLRTASVASFIDLIKRLSAGTPVPQPSAPISHFCLRHG